MNQTQPLRILLAENRPPLRKGLALSCSKSFTCTACAIRKRSNHKGRYKSAKI